MTLGRQMALEWAIDGIRVKVVLPGTIDTPAVCYLSDEAIATRKNQNPIRPPLACKRAGRHGIIPRLARRVVHHRAVLRRRRRVLPEIYPQPMGMQEALREQVEKLAIRAMPGTSRPYNGRRSRSSRFIGSVSGRPPRGPRTSSRGRCAATCSAKPMRPGVWCCESNTFEPGARTAWHTHPLGQTLIVTAGYGCVQRDGGPVEEMRPGDVVFIPAGGRHWHGAPPITAMTHIAVTEMLDGKAGESLEHVTDEQYRDRFLASRRRDRDGEELVERFENRTFVVTGGGSGMGAATRSGGFSTRAPRLWLSISRRRKRNRPSMPPAPGRRGRAPPA